MEDIENREVDSEKDISVRLVIASCLAQFLAPVVGILTFDLATSPPNDFILAPDLIGVMRLVTHSWMLAMEPLTTAIVLAFCSSAIQIRRNWITLIVMVTLLNALVSTMFIIGRSL